MPEKKNTYLTLHKNFVRTDIEYADRVTGESRTFNSVTLPKGTVIDGVDVSYYQFSPMFVNESRFRGENYRDIPLLTDREVWLKKSVLDENGQPIVDENGKPAKDVVRVMPAQIKEALDRSLTDGSGNPVTDTQKAHADMATPDERARVSRPMFTLKAGIDYPPDERYFLVCRDKETGEIAWKEEFTIDMAFAPSVDFGF